MDRELVDRIWEKASDIDGYDGDVIRKDTCGAWIIYSDYGNRDSEYGWEIDHTYPESMGGGDEEINLRPMHWKNNVSKGDDYPSYLAEIYASGNENIEVERRMKVNDNLQEKLAEIYGKDNR